MYSAFLLETMTFFKCSTYSTAYAVVLCMGVLLTTGVYTVHTQGGIPIVIARPSTVVLPFLMHMQGCMNCVSVAKDAASLKKCLSCVQSGVSVSNCGVCLSKLFPSAISACYTCLAKQHPNPGACFVEAEKQI